MRIRKFHKEDLPAVLRIQAENPIAAQWLARDYERLNDDSHGLILVAEPETATPASVVGFVATHRIMDEAEIRNIAVAREHQRRGIARALLAETCKRLTEAGARRIFLEVRTSNQAAFKLYCSAGWGLHSMRKSYYNNPAEDAYILALELFPRVG
jgi:[ribosomal protein S18]-alanine N-acetyltransferase